jgi:threonine/homoserine/homoserine lactone efflux protein
VLSELIPLALVVALSPLSIIPAVVLVLHTDHPRPTGMAFLSGWLVGLAAVTAFFVQVPRLLDGLNQAPPRWATWVRIAVGLVLIAFGVWRWATRHRSTGPPAMLNRMSRITPIAAAVVGIVLVVTNPKVLVMNAAAGLMIGTADFGVPGTWTAVAYYTAIAGSTVAVPILAYVVAAERVDRQLERLKQWVERQHAVLTAMILVVIGLVLLYTGIRQV